jgi:hypothetical protein
MRFFVILVIFASDNRQYAASVFISLANFLSKFSQRIRAGFASHRAWLSKLSAGG